MTKRRETPDVLGDVLGGEPAPAAGQPAQQPDSMPASQPAGEPALAGEKVKATYYLTESVVDSLDEALVAIRQLAPRAQRRSISRSSIVETALLVALEELEAQGRESRLARILASQ